VTQQVSDLGLNLGHRKKHRPRRGRGYVAVLVALVILGGLGYLAYSMGFHALKERFAPPPDFTGSGHGTVVVQVKQGEAATQIGSTLVAKGVVKSADAFHDAAVSNPKSALIQVGFYQLKHRMSATSALDVLVDPHNLVQNAVTIPEGWTVKQIVAALDKKTKFSAKQYDKVLRSPSQIGLPSYANGKPEGYLYPATYELPPNATPKSILTMMVDRYDQAATDMKVSSKAAQLGYSPHDVMTVASLVQAEARKSQDFSKVARVIYNRLQKKMPLQFDSTVHYAVGKDGSVGTSAADRSVNSPYNTYKVTGLPPTPISAPGDQAIKAALNPASGPWLYFVTVNPDTGETKFATTYAEHLKNVKQFNKWCAKSSHC
jgi:UPF0755 protein